MTISLAPSSAGDVVPNNVYRFRRLKWGDPAKKLPMMPKQPRAAAGWESAAIAAGLVVIAILLFYIFQA